MSKHFYPSKLLEVYDWNIQYSDSFIVSYIYAKSGTWYAVEQSTLGELSLREVKGFLTVKNLDKMRERLVSQPNGEGDTPLTNLTRNESDSELNQLKHW